MNQDGIALVGIGCALEGPDDVDRLWAALMNGVPLTPSAGRVDALGAALANAGLAHASDDALRTIVKDSVAELIEALHDVRSGACSRLAVVGGPDASGIALVFESLSSAQQREAPVWARVVLAALPEPGSLQRAYAEEGVDPRSIGLLSVGGVRDLSALNALFGEASDPLRPLNGVATGTRALDGLLVLAAAALATSNKLIPPTAETLSDAFEAAVPFYPNLDARPWVQDPSLGPRRAAAHGAIHVVFEEVSTLARPIRTGIAWPSELVRLSADSPSELCQAVDLLDERVRNGVSFERLARRCDLECDESKPYRLGIIAVNTPDLRSKLATCRERLAGDAPVFPSREDIFFGADIRGTAGKVACLFPGLAIPGFLGTYAEHLLDLALCFPAARAALDCVDARDHHPDDPIPTNQLLFPPRQLPEALRTRYRNRWAIPTLDSVKKHTTDDQSNLCHFGVTVSNMVGWRLLQTLGVPIDMFFGQSEGDLTALAAAGSLVFDEVFHSHASQRLKPEHFPFNCNLAIVNSDGERLDEVIEEFPNIAVAMYAAPHLQLVGGRPDHIATFVRELRARKILAQKLPYPAVHTEAFTEILAIVAKEVEQFSVRPPSTPTYSGITASPHGEDVDEIRRNLIHNINRPVRLWQTLRAMCDDGARVFLQVGDGGSMLHRYAPRATERDDVFGVSMDLDYRNAITQLQAFCATLWTIGVPVDFSALSTHRSAEEAKQRDEPGETHGLPFVGTIHRQVDESFVEFERVLDLEEDRHLTHHKYITAAGTKPDSACLPVLPFTFSLELMAEAAALIAPAHGLIGFEDVRASKWIGLRDATQLRLRVTARAQPDDATTTRRIDVAVWVPDAEEPAVEGVVLFDVAYRADVELALAPLQDARPYPFSAEECYERLLWHGPLLQCIRGRPTVGSAAVTGELEVLPTAGLFRSTTDPAFLTDPVFMDAVGQLLGLWCVDRGLYPFPIAVEKIELYCPTPPVGTRVPVHVEVTRQDARFVWADAEVQDGTGHVWMRVRGLRDWSYHWPAHNEAVRRQPQLHLLAHALPASSDGGAGFEVTEADLFDSDLDHLARLYLTLDEMTQFERRPLEERMRWFLPRIAAKDAVRRVLADVHDASKMAHPASFALEELESGAPVVVGLETDATPQVRVAFTEDGAVAVAHSRAGVDT